MINNDKGREQLDTTYMIITHFRLRISGLQNVFLAISDKEKATNNNSGIVANRNV